MNTRYGVGRNMLGEWYVFGIREDGSHDRQFFPTKEDALMYILLNGKYVVDFGED